VACSGVGGYLNLETKCGTIPVTRTLVLEWLQENDDREFWIKIRNRNLSEIRERLAANEAIEYYFNLRDGHELKQHKRK